MAYLDLYRSGDIDHEIIVTYAITNGTARPNIDFVPTNGVVSIAANFRNARVDLSKVIFDNGTVDGDRTVLVDLWQNDNGESASIWSRQEIPLEDNEIPGSLVADFRIAGRLLGVEPNGRLLVYGPLPTGSGRGVFRALPGGRVDLSFSVSLSRPQPTPGTNSNDYYGPLFESLRYEPFAAREADGSWLVIWKDDLSDSVPARLVRLQADGKLDSDLKPAAGGLSNYEFDISPIWPQRDLQFIAPLPNGQFLAYVVNRTDGQYAIIRLNADGSFDSAFNPIQSASGHRILAVTATGKLLVEFSQYTSPQGRFSLRLSDGLIDGSFDGSDIGEWCNSLEIDAALEQPDGKIVVSARSFLNSEPAYVSNLARFCSDGKRDATFAEVEFNGLLHYFALDSDRRPVAAALNGGGGSGFIRARTDGSLERFPFPPFSSNLRKYALQSDGTVLVEALLGDSPGTPYIFRCDFSKTFEPRVEIQSLWNGAAPVEREVRESTGDYELIVRRLGNSSQVLPVRVETCDGTALAGEGYFPISQVLIFAPLELEKTITVSILPDQKAEGDEEFLIVLTDLNNPALSPTPLRIRILDEEPSEMFTFGPVREPGGGITPSFIRLIFNAPPNEAWHVEASTDLKNWSRAGLSGSPNGMIAREWIDASTENFPQRFYRAVKE